MKIINTDNNNNKNNNVNIQKINVLYARTRSGAVGKSLGAGTRLRSCKTWSTAADNRIWFFPRFWSRSLGPGTTFPIRCSLCNTSRITISSKYGNDDDNKNKKMKKIVYNRGDNFEKPFLYCALSVVKIRKSNRWGKRNPFQEGEDA